jgi:hypothetical protein
MPSACRTLDVLQKRRAILKLNLADKEDVKEAPKQIRPTYAKMELMM